MIPANTCSKSRVTKFFVQNRSGRPTSFLILIRLQRGANTIGDVRLTLEALRILSNQPQNIQAAVDLKRHPDGIVDVTGVLPTRQEAQSLIESLQSLRGGATLRIDLHSADEPQTARRVSRIELSSPSVSIATDRIPLDSMLRESLSARSGLSGAELDEQVQRAARQIVERSSRVHRSAWAVSQIGSQDFRGSELAQMSAQDRQLWLALLARPLMTCDAMLNAIATTLTGGRGIPILFPNKT